MSRAKHRFSADMLLSALGVSLVYYLAARIGQALSFSSDYFGAVWPPSAVLLAALLKSHPRRWPLLLMAVVPAALAAQLPSGGTWWQALGLVFANLFECWLAAYFLRRWTIVPTGFDNLRQAIIYVLVAVLAAPAMAGAFGAGWSALAGTDKDIFVSWRRWTMSDGLTHLAITPFVLAWFSKKRVISFVSSDGSRWIEGIAVVCAASAVSVLVFCSPFPTLPRVAGLPFLVYLPLPVLVWAALRFRSSGISATGFVITLTAIWSSAAGLGPFTENGVEGNVIGLQLFLLISLTPMIFLASLISERGQVAQMVREAAQRLSLHVKYNPLGVIELNRSFMVVEWNRSAELIFGFTRREAIGRSVWDLIVPESEREAMRAAWAAVPEPGSTGEPHVFSNHTRDGNVVLCEWYNSPLLNFEGEVFGTAAMVQDVTARRLMEEEISQTQKMEAVGRLAGGIAHDFNNLLTAILGHCELALLKKIEDPSLKTAFMEIERAGMRARDTVKQILGFSHQQTGDRVQIDMRALVGEVVGFVRTSIPSNVQISSVITEQDCAILGDSSQVHRVLMNLVTNAYQAMREREGLIHIELSRGSATNADGRLVDAVRLSVRDSGPGMTEEVRMRIFDPFFTTKKIGEGSGMGLAVVHGIVIQHGGWIEVDSSMGSGSEFHVWLPHYQGSAVNAARPAPLEELPGGKGRILLVDDDPVVVRIEAAMLEQLGYDVEVTTRATEGWRRLEASPERFDLLITDQAMPNLTGLQIVERVRERRWDTPVIMCTGYSELLEPAKVEELAIDAVIFKPVSLEEFARGVYEVLGQRKEESSP